MAVKEAIRFIGIYCVSGHTIIIEVLSVNKYIQGSSFEFENLSISVKLSLYAPRFPQNYRQCPRP